MSSDFRASQLQTNKIIASGSSGTATNAKLLIYPISSEDSNSPNQGIVDTGLFGISSIGTDIFMFVSGAIGAVGVSGSHGISAFGGDVYVSGSITAAGGFVGVSSGGEVSASYIVYALTASLPNAKAPVAGPGITITTAGTASLVIAANSIPSLIDALSSSFILSTATTASLPNSRVIVAGPGITVSSGNLGRLEISASAVVTGTWLEGSPSPRLRTSASVAIGSDSLFAQQKGADVFFYVSGAMQSIGQTTNPGVSVFGGDLVVSGNLYVSGTQIPTASLFRLQITDYASTTNTSSNPAVIGQIIFPANEYSGRLTLRGILSTDGAGNGPATVKFWNLTSGVYVDIGGTGVTTLSTDNTTPTMVESVELSGAVGFSTTARHLYELHLYSVTGSSVAYAGGWELRPSGSFTNVTVPVNTRIFDQAVSGSTTSTNFDIYLYNTAGVTSSLILHAPTDPQMILLKKITTDPGPIYLHPSQGWTIESGSVDATWLLSSSINTTRPSFTITFNPANSMVWVS